MAEQWHRTASHLGGDAVVYISEKYPNDWIANDGSTRNYVELGVFDREGLNFSNPTSTSIQCLTDDREDPFDEMITDATQSFSIKFKELGHIHQAILSGQAPESMSYASDKITIKSGVIAETVPEYEVKIRLNTRVSEKYHYRYFPSCKVKLDGSSQEDYSRGKYTDIMINFTAEYDSTDACVSYVELEDKYTALAITVDSGDEESFIDAAACVKAGFVSAGWPSWVYEDANGTAVDNGLAGMLYVVTDGSNGAADYTGDKRIIISNTISTGEVTVARPWSSSGVATADDTGEIVFSISA